MPDQAVMEALYKKYPDLARKPPDDVYRTFVIDDATKAKLEAYVKDPTILGAPGVEAANFRLVEIPFMGINLKDVPNLPPRR